MNKIEKINIRPKVNIYSTFRRHSYTHDSAIAEFIDNSSQSFIDNLEKINELKIQPKIFIIYNSTKENEELFVVDNGFGINDTNLDRVLKLNELPLNRKGRNEFGLGLKAAAFWFGNKLEIYTKHMYNNYSSKLTLDLDNLSDDTDYIQPVYSNGSDLLKEVSLFEHGTTIKLSKIVNKMTVKSLKKIVNSFSSKYREDIEKYNLEIRVIKVEIDKTKKTRILYDVSKSSDVDHFVTIENINDASPLEFQPPKLKRNENNELIKNDIDFQIEFEGETHNVKGYVGLLEEGSRSKAGLVLMRRGRTIIGDTKTYKPSEIFRDPGSFEYQRIYGLIELDSFPVVFSKDAFDWNNGLEEKFISQMKDAIMNGKFNLIRMARTERYNEKKQIKSQQLLNSDFVASMMDEMSKNKILENSVFSLPDDENKKHFVYEIIDKLGEKIKFNIYLDLPETEEGKWMILREIKNAETNNEWNLYIDFKHDFFCPFNNNEEIVKNQIIKFCLFFAYSEIKHKKVCQIWYGIRDDINMLFSNEYKSKVIVNKIANDKTNE